MKKRNSTAGKKEHLTPIPKPARRKPPAPTDRDGSEFSAVPAATAPAGPDLSHIAPGLLKPEVVSLSDLAYLIGNAVTHPEKQIAEIKSSIKQFQQVELLIVNKRETPPVVIGGNGRLQAMLSAGYTHAAVCFVDLPPEKAKLLSLNLNRIAEGREWQQDAVTKMLAEIKADNGVNGAAALLDDPGTQKMFADLEKEFAPKPAGEPDAAAGDAAPEQTPAPEKLGVLVECRDTGHQQQLVTALAELGETGRALSFTEKLIEKSKAA